ncbi:MAG TPA: hypothetical protein VGN95_04040 [Pyrinomonadaceae bacterium]|jgi:hypothetical protein|nr:hypothetical protein [Pyrinomonadaceae bacterium]
MTGVSNTPMKTIVLWAIARALVFIATAIVFKGNPVEDWFQAALFIGALSFGYCHPNDCPTAANMFHRL